MANSRFAYVRDFELPDRLLPGTFILFRIDGHAFRQCPPLFNLLL
jgi:tRNA(His) guanylyltransferase